MENEKSPCLNCKFFTRHYYWWHARLVEMEFGHCLKHSYKSFYRHFPPKNGCELWVSDEENRKADKKYIVDKLTETVRFINDIKAYLGAEHKDDGELF